MEIWKRVRAVWSSWRSKPAATLPTNVEPEAGESHLDLARESLRALVQDERVPAAVRLELAADYQQIEAMLEKLEHGHLHIAAVGRVSVGKSSVLNALLEQERFRTSPLHGETKRSELAQWDEVEAGGVCLIDTPGIDEVDGEQRERMAHEVAGRADLVLFVVDGDMTETELQALRAVAAEHRPIIAVLNKVDRYTPQEQSLLLTSLQRHTRGLVDPRNIVCVAAQPARRTVIKVDHTGKETETTRAQAADVAALKQRLWEVLEAEGKTLAALNASLFAGKLTEQVTARIMATRQTLALRTVRTYCLAKGVVVALNPIPLADLFAAAVMDATMVVHLSRIYGLPLSRRESGALIGTISAQIVALVGTVWTINIASSMLKMSTGGLSTAVTAGAQGAIAYYATLVVGRAAERYLAQGKSWQEGGPKRVVEQILASLDRDSILAEAQQEIGARLKRVA